MKSLASVTKAPSLWNIAAALTMLVYAAGLFVTIMEPDAAVYAEISMGMHDTGNFLSIFHKGSDWLDKPHFPFWMSAISYKLFGVSVFAYKLPAVLFVLLGAAYTFLFARRFYSSMHGYIAVLVLITAQHIIISNQDVRAEPFMTGLTIMALYHFTFYVELRRLHHMIIGCGALACLIMTKGLFTIIPVVAAIGLSLLYHRDWKRIFDFRWLLCPIIILIFLLPSLYGYYTQFDLHPQKQIFGKQNVSGVEFFLWTSQWGRFTNTGPIKGKGDLFYFVHTLLWAFLPWAFLAFFSLYRKTRDLIRRKVGGETYTYFRARGIGGNRKVGNAVGETFTYFGFMVLFLIFSASRFQLSFYLNPLFPFLAIITAAGLLGMTRKALKTFSVIHIILGCLLIIGLCLLHSFFMNKMPHLDTIIILLGGISLAMYIFFHKGYFFKKILFGTVLVSLSVNYYLNRDFYPALLNYQSESEVAYFMRSEKLPSERLVVLGDVESVADVILHRVIPVIPIEDVSVYQLDGKYVYTSLEGRGRIDSLGMKYNVVKHFDDFHVTMLTGAFINKKTRGSAIEKKVLLEME